MIIKKILCADFETVTINTKYYQEHQDTKVLLWNIREKDSENVVGIGTSIESFFDCLKSLKYSCIVYFHNLGWDGDFILKYLTQDHKMVYQLKKYQVAFSAFKDRGKIYRIDYQYRYNGKTINNNDSSYYRKIIFKCSYRMLSSGIDALGKDIGINKYEQGQDIQEFYDVEPKENYKDYDPKFVEYCLRDTLIMCRVLNAFDQTLNELYESEIEYDNYKIKLDFLKSSKWTNNLTISSFGRKIQSQMVYHNPLLRYKGNDIKKAKKKHQGKHVKKGMTHSIKDNEIADYFYYGGFTQFNIRYHNKKIDCENGACIDVNSMHPFNMTKKLPYGDLHNMKDFDYKIIGLNENDVCEFYEIEFDYAENLHSGFACLLNWNNKIRYIQQLHLKRKKDRNIDIDQELDELVNSANRYLFDCGKSKCYYYKEEWIAIQKWYRFENVKIINHYWMKANRYLGFFVETFYNKRQEYKQAGKLAQANTFKIFLNAAYGVHGKKPDYITNYVCDNFKEYEKLQAGTHFTINHGTKTKEYVVASYQSPLNQLENQYIISCNELDLDKANNKFIAAVVTSYSRIMLWDMILKLGVNNCVYCDTDSVYIRNFTKEQEKDLLDQGLLHKTKLGAWDKETTFKAIWVKGAKRYEIYDHDGNKQSTKFAGVSKKLLQKDNFNFKALDDEILVGASLKIKRCKSGLVLEPKDLKIKLGSH